jgi:uncharacterized protein (TIGR03086 family)
MNDAADQYRRRADAFEQLITNTLPERWDSQSPCTQWTARGVVAHVVDDSRRIVREQSVLPEVAPFADFDNPLAAFQAARAVIEQVLADPVTPEKAVVFMQWSLSFDLPQHSWDLAKATGQDASLDPAEVELLWGSLSGNPRLWEWQRASGWYAAPVPIPENAPLQDRVLGLLGRDPNWQPPS